MRKLIYFAGALIIASMIMTSCANSVESDAKEVADITCEAGKLMEKSFAGDSTAAKEMEELGAKMEALSTELQEKYKTPEEQKAFQEAYMKALEECK